MNLFAGTAYLPPPPPYEPPPPQETPEQQFNKQVSLKGEVLFVRQVLQKYTVLLKKVEWSSTEMTMQ